MASIGPHCATANFTTYKTPWGLTVTINKALIPRFKRACEDAVKKNASRKRRGLSTWEPKRMDSYNCRQIRGSSAWSRHAYAAAWDLFNKPYPQPVDVWGSTNSPPKWFARCFKKYGFTWGGDWISRKDYPHIEWSSSVVPALAPPVVDRIIVRATKVFTSDRKARRALKRLIAGGWEAEKVRD